MDKLGSEKSKKIMVVLVFLLMAFVALMLVAPGCVFPFACCTVPYICVLIRYVTATVTVARTSRSRMLGCLRFTKLCWVGKHVTIVLKSTNPPTQGQPNPRKIRLQVAFGPLFPPANKFSWVSIVFFRGNIFKETQPGQILRKHPICNYGQGEG